MKKTLAVALLVAMLPMCASAKPFYKSKRWWAGVAVIGAAVALDAHSSCQAFSRGGLETNPLIYGTRSCGEVSGLMVGAFGFYTTMHALEWHVTQRDPNKAIGFTGLVALPAVALGVHLPAAIHNYGIEAPRAIAPIRCEDEKRDRFPCDRSRF